MKKKVRKKNVYILLFILILILLLVFLSKYASDQEKDKTNLSGDNLSISENNDTQTEDIIRIDTTKQIENIEISNICIQQLERNKCQFTADIKNTSTEFSESKVIEITAVDEKGEMIAVFSGLVSKLAGMEEEEFVTQILKDITMVKDVEIAIVK